VHDLIIRLAEHGGKISPLVKHAHDLNLPVDYTVENRVWMHQHGPQPRHDLIARAPHQRLFSKTLSSSVDFAQKLVSYLSLGDTLIIPPNIAQVAPAFGRPDNAPTLFWHALRGPAG
jgi:hypothetical protein